jgi:hypothetical protein
MICVAERVNFTGKERWCEKLSRTSPSIPDLFQIQVYIARAVLLTSELSLGVRLLCACFS